MEQFSKGSYKDLAKDHYRRNIRVKEKKFKILVKLLRSKF